jgi:cbb3-type cytochrome c oxidase subunit III
VLAVAAVAGALAFAGAGCGTGGLPESGDTGQGRRLFVENCGSCHTLAGAGTQGRIGPNLDEAFGPGRQQGFKASTIRAIVYDQIKYPSPPDVSPRVPAMPANLVEGDDVDAVASYVASVAGSPPRQGGETGGGGGRVAATSGKEIFGQAGCGSCHTLSDAGSNGTVGPNLDEAKPTFQLAVERVTNGKGAMPPFRDKLNSKQIRAVADYVSTAAGK